MELLLQGGTVVTATETFAADVLIENGIISKIGRDMEAQEAEVVDVKGKYVMPGMIDVHTHMALPFGGTVSADDFFDGTKAAAFGGVTTIVDFAIQAKGESLKETIARRRAEADDKVCIDYGLHPAVTDFRPEVLAEIPEIIKEGFPSFKLFMIYPDWAVDDGTLFETIKQVTQNGGLVGVHAENKTLIDKAVDRLLREGKKEPKYHAESRPPYVEAEAVGRAARWANETGGSLYIFHTTSKKALEEIMNYKGKGTNIFAETCMQYLLLDDTCYLEENFGGAKYVMSPPIRKKEDQEALWKGLSQGFIGVVSSDHCPFTLEQKRLGEGDFTKIPNGAPGVETTLSLLYSEGVLKNRISLNKLVEVFSANPARMFGMSPRKGSIAVGTDADLVIFDPEKKVTLDYKKLHMGADYNPYQGWEVTGYPVMTISKGKIICREDEWLGAAGEGKLLRRSTGF